MDGAGFKGAKMIKDRFAYEYRFERALEDLWPKLSMEQLTKLEIITLGSAIKYYGDEIIEALQLAAEHERVKKERDELAEIILEADDALNTLFGEEANVLAKKVRNENGNA